MERLECVDRYSRGIVRNIGYSTAKAFTTWKEDDDENPIDVVGEPSWIKDGLVAWYPFNGNV